MLGVSHTWHPFRIFVPKGHSFGFSMTRRTVNLKVSCCFCLTVLSVEQTKISPKPDWLVIQGVDPTNDAGNVYISPFDNYGQPGVLQNLTRTNLVDEWQVYWAGNQVVWKGGTQPPSPTSRPTHPTRNPRIILSAPEISYPSLCAFLIVVDR